MVKRWKMAGGDVVSRVGDDLFLRAYDTTLARVDLSKLPPKRTKSKIKFPLVVDKLDAKRWIVSCHDRSVQPIRLPVVVGTDPLVADRELVKRMPGRGMSNVQVIDGRVYASDVDEEPPTLLRRDGDAFVAVKGISKAKLDTFGKAITGDGREVLIWNGDGYVHEGDKLTKRFSLGAINPDWSSVPAPGGFYYVSDRTLMLAGEKKRGVHADAKNITRISPGPRDSLLLRFADNPKRWQFGVYDGKVRGYRANKLGTLRDVLWAVEWSAAAERIFVLTSDTGMVAVTPDEIGYL